MLALHGVSRTRDHRHRRNDQGDRRYRKAAKFDVGDPRRTPQSVAAPPRTPSQALRCFYILCCVCLRQICRTSHKLHSEKPAKIGVKCSTRSPWETPAGEVYPGGSEVDLILGILRAHWWFLVEIVDKNLESYCMIEEGDRVAVRCQLTATNYDGKPCERSIMAIYRFENGRIAEDWSISIMGLWP